MSINLFSSAATLSFLSSQFTLAYAATTLPECKLPDCEEIMEGKLHSLEKRVLDGVWPSKMIEDGFPFNQFAYYFNNEDRKEYLRFRNDDKKHKFLFLSSQDSYGFSHGMGAEIPKFKLLQDINEKYDLKFKVVDSHKEICEQVKEAAKIGKLAHVILDANGDSEKLCLADYNTCMFGGVDTLKQNINEEKEFLECFKGVDPSGKIILLSNLAGAPKNGDPKENIAQKMATAAKRSIIAPINWFIYRTEMPNLEDFEVFNTQSNNILYQMFRKGTNIYKLFNPIYSNCVDIFKKTIHTREQSAIDVVKKETQSKSTLLQPEEFDDLQDLLRFCKDDPKQKFLYLSMESDHNGALDPKYVSKILEPVSKEYDLKFKVIKSYDELCNEIKEANKSGELTNIVIDGHGNPTGTHISGESFDQYGYKIEKNWIHMTRNLSKCFESADLSKITLFSCTTAAPYNGDPKNNIANKIANETGKTVVAPIDSISGTNTKLTSINPFEVYHPSECYKGRCKSVVDTFQTIKPNKKP